jgi:hypothetical protein
VLSGLGPACGSCAGAAPFGCCHSCSGCYRGGWSSPALSLLLLLLLALPWRWWLPQPVQVLPIPVDSEDTCKQHTMMIRCLQTHKVLCAICST